MGARHKIRNRFSLAAYLSSIVFVLAGCSAEEENLKPDEGVSPFYTGKPVDPQLQEHPSVEVRPVTKLGDLDKNQNSQKSHEPADTKKDSSDLSGSSKPAQFSFEDLDKLIKAGAKLAETGKFVESAKVFDQVLGAEPENRVALLFRAVVGTEILNGLSQQDRITEIGHCAELMRTLKKTYKTLQPKESAAYVVAIFNEAVVLGNEGQTDVCLGVLQEAVDAGFSKWDRLETSDAFNSMRDDPRFKKLITEMKSNALKTARQTSRVRPASEKTFPFSFRLKDPDGKEYTTEDFKGKVVLIDFWGTWCGPCRGAIPGLIDLHRKFSEQGLAIVGIACEQAPADDAKDLVKRFVKEFEVPYLCVMGDEATQLQVPGFSGYPTTLLLDENGKVRFLSRGAQEGEAQAIEDAVIVLLDDMNSKSKASTEVSKKP